LKNIKSRVESEKEKMEVALKDERMRSEEER
jgi:hypothetical protein